MKPLNLDNKPCSPISSNCVIWQGPDIPCIKLCTGDTVSDVVAKLATDSTLRAKMGAAGKEYTMARYGVARLIKDHQDLYLKLLKR